MLFLEYKYFNSLWRVSRLQFLCFREVLKNENKYVKDKLIFIAPMCQLFVLVNHSKFIAKANESL